MKTPEEIKRGLEGCGGLDGDCENCPYDEQTIYCNDRLMRDALAYIRPLEERNKTLEYTLLGVMHSIDKWLDVEPYGYDKDEGTEAATRAANAREVALKAIDQLESRLAQVERERDAAVADLKDDGDCYYCKNRDLAAQCDFGSCIDCGNEECPCFRCDRMKNHFEWRGVCPKNTKEE